ncbi:MBL fold metallo-hydrolase [Rubrimonas cliftonensis]|uniref:Glyoxylase, beta-lactamase superfamily II n=1 Tax=Rubrimonas cliftonensis TaxID=89524 RepID=A0A1H4BFD0_9RHOB|nr:MBL fold metallo-hydrolase [Rubrimonas cliftonensis]SEA46840.1 Glyoxylase, beta-lactamase superfamily II [Rubrimonas cliftonensis]
MTDHTFAASALTRRAALAAPAVLGAALAAAAGGAPARAAAPMQGPMRPGVRRVALGGFEVTTLHDGYVVAGDPHGIFGTDRPQAEVHALAEENLLPATALVNNYTVTLLNTGAELILFDTGNAPATEGTRGFTLARLAEAGVSPEQIDVVVITHMHGDHIGGLMTDGAPTFPNARYVMGAREYDAWTNGGVPEERAAGVIPIVTPLAEKTTFIEPGQSVVSGVEAVEAFGHAPGHMVYHLESEGRRLMVTADTANHFVLSLQRPDWEVRFDMDKAAAAATRRKIFGMIAADRVPFIGYHMPFPAIGYVEALGEGFRYIPETYQLAI